MKTSFILIIFYTLFGYSQQTKCNNDYNLKGHVKEVDETTSYTKHDVMPEYNIKTVYFLDYNDYVLSIEEPNMNGQIQKKAFQYDKDNIIKEIKVTVKGKTISKNTYIKNEKNQIFKIKIDDLNGKSEIINYYNGSPDLPVSGKKFENGDISRSWEIEYKNKLVSVFTSFVSDIKTQTFYTYNSNNDIIEVIEKNSDGEILNQQFSEYKYDSKGNWEEKTVYDSNKKIISSSKRQIKYW